VLKGNQINISEPGTMARQASSLCVSRYLLWQHWFLLCDSIWNIKKSYLFFLKRSGSAWRHLWRPRARRRVSARHCVCS